jgi:cobalt/nickel transport system permease protein
MKRFMVRTWLFIPIFTAVIALPSTLNIITPGRELYRIGILDLSITYEGLERATLLIIRVATSISYITLLMSTTRWIEITNSLERLGLPQPFNDILRLTYRYILTLIDNAYKMLLSLRSRNVGEDGWIDSIREGSKLLGALYMKTYYTSEMLYLSMVSRGFKNRDIKLYESSTHRSGRMTLIFIVIILASIISTSLMEVCP